MTRIRSVLPISAVAMLQLDWGSPSVGLWLSPAYSFLVFSTPSPWEYEVLYVLHNKQIITASHVLITLCPLKRMLVPKSGHQITIGHSSPCVAEALLPVVFRC